MADVFISYASADRPRVARLVEALGRAGFDLWWDRQLQPGEPFRNQLPEQLLSAKLVLVCWSEASVKSRYVQAEAESAANAGRYFPVMLQSCALPFGLADRNAFDLCAWREEDYDLSLLDQLVRAIAARLSSDADLAAQNLKARRFGRRLETSAFAGFTATSLAGLAGLAFGWIAAPAEIAPALRGALAVGGGLAAFFALGALGRGLGGTSGALRIGSAAAAAAVMWMAAPLAQHRLAPGPLMLASPAEFSLRHSKDRSDSPEDILGSATRIVAPVSLFRDGEQAIGSAQTIKATLAIDDDKLRYRLVANSFTQLSIGSTSGPLTPILGEINFPVRLDGSPSRELVFVPEKKIAWKDMLNYLTDAEREITLTLTVQQRERELSVTCIANDIFTRVQEMITRSEENKVVNYVSYSCQEIRS